MLNKIEKSLVFAIVILAILCLIMTPKKGHPEIYDTTIDLRKPDTTMVSPDSLDTLKCKTGISDDNKERKIWNCHTHPKN